jgi:hypothetical protein
MKSSSRKKQDMKQLSGSAQSPIGIRETRHRPPPKGAGDGVFRGFHPLDFEHSQLSVFA